MAMDLTSQQSESEIDQRIRRGINERRLLQLRYQQRERIIEPHDYGIQNGALRLLAFQVGGSSSGRLPNWRWLDVAQMSDVQLLDRKFQGGRPSGRHHKWDQLFVRVAPPD